jgi:hypothetical protein
LGVYGSSEQEVVGVFVRFDAPLHRHTGHVKKTSEKLKTVTRLLEICIFLFEKGQYLRIFFFFFFNVNSNGFGTKKQS